MMNPEELTITIKESYDSPGSIPGRYSLHDAAAAHPQGASRKVLSWRSAADK
jgi:hypothetical protein